VVSYRLTLNGVVVFEGVQLQHPLDGLTAATNFAVSLTACNVAGCVSSEANFGTLEAAPNGVGAPEAFNVGARSIALRWAPPQEPNGQVRYTVQRRAEPADTEGFQSLEPSGLLSTVFVDQPLAPAAAFSYRILAFTTAGEGTSAVLSVQTLEAAPEGVGQPRAVATGPTSANVTWPAPLQPNGAIVRYLVTVRLSSPSQFVMEIDAVNTSAVLLGLDAFTAYTVTVTACTAAGCTSGSAANLLTLEDG
jgi:usherin